MTTSLTSQKPTAKDQAAAKKSSLALKKISRLSALGNAVTIKLDGIDIKLPNKALIILKKVLDEMAVGRAVVITSFNDELSTQEAADFLNVSRPHLVKLLETGEIPYKKVGTHRRVQLDDIIKYDDFRREDRRKALDEIAKDAQDMGLGY